MSTGPRPVQFTRQSAERIAAVVRQAELTPFPGRALEFDAVANAQGKKVFRVGTFTGAWSVGGTKTVTIRNSTATISAVNLFLNIGVDCGNRNCAIAKDGAAWYLISAECG